jgi:release factor glutamine methyltransferase
MLDAPVQSLLAEHRPGALGTLAGRFLHLSYRLTGKARYDDFRLEHVADLAILVIPGVANPKLLRTATVLDMGTGSGVCALTAARRARRVVAVDVSPAAVRCARINVLLNRLEERVDVREGDLFAPLAGERFDLVLFNPPFLVGVPKDHRDAAWRSVDAAHRFSAGLEDHLAPRGEALVLLSSFGDACALFETELRARGFDLEVYARRRYVNETVTIVRAMRSARERA